MGVESLTFLCTLENLPYITQKLPASLSLPPCLKTQNSLTLLQVPILSLLSLTLHLFCIQEFYPLSLPVSVFQVLFSLPCLFFHLRVSLFSRRPTSTEKPPLPQLDSTFPTRISLQPQLHTHQTVAIPSFGALMLLLLFTFNYYPLPLTLFARPPHQLHGRGGKKCASSPASETCNSRVTFQFKKMKKEYFIPLIIFSPYITFSKIKLIML